MLKMFPKTHITIAAATTVVVTAAILMSPSADVEAKRMSYTLDLEQGKASEIISKKPQQKPEASPEKVVAEVQPEAAPQMPEQASPALTPRLAWQTFDIKSGDTLSSLFKKAGFNDGIMLSVIHGEGEADKLQRLYAGETIRFATDGEGEIASVELQRNRL